MFPLTANFQLKSAQYSIVHKSPKLIGTLFMFKVKALTPWVNPNRTDKP